MHKPIRCGRFCKQTRERNNWKFKCESQRQSKHERSFNKRKDTAEQMINAFEKWNKSQDFEKAASEIEKKTNESVNQNKQHEKTNHAQHVVIPMKRRPDPIRHRFVIDASSPRPIIVPSNAPSVEINPNHKPDNTNPPSKIYKMTSIVRGVIESL